MDDVLSAMSTQEENTMKEKNVKTTVDEAIEELENSEFMVSQGERVSLVQSDKPVEVIIGKEKSEALKKYAEEFISKFSEKYDGIEERIEKALKTNSINSIKDELFNVIDDGAKMLKDIITVACDEMEKEVEKTALEDVEKENLIKDRINSTETTLDNLFDMAKDYQENNKDYSISNKTLVFIKNSRKSIKEHDLNDDLIATLDIIDAECLEHENTIKTLIDLSNEMNKIKNKIETIGNKTKEENVEEAASEDVRYNGFNEFQKSTYNTLLSLFKSIRNKTDDINKVYSLLWSDDYVQTKFYKICFSPDYMTNKFFKNIDFNNLNEEMIYEFMFDIAEYFEDESKVPPFSTFKSECKMIA